MPERKAEPVNDDDALEQAAAAVEAAKRDLYAARRVLATAVQAARRSGVSVARIAARTGLDAGAVRNMLAAAGVR